MSLTSYIFQKLDLRIVLAPPNTTDTIPSIVIANVSRTLVTRASDRGIYIFTAFTRLVQNKRVVFINGWEEKLLLKEHDHFCCFLLMNGTVLHNNLFLLTTFTYNPRLKATLFGCAVHPSMSESETFAVSVSVIKHQSVTLPTPAKKALPNPKPIGKNAQAICKHGQIASRTILRSTFLDFTKLKPVCIKTSC